MKPRIESVRLPWLAVAASLVICYGTWRWAESILVPVNTRAAQSKGIPIGNNSDLYPRWFGARELLLHHRDPYSTEVTAGIQRGFYGRALDPRNPGDPADQVAFAYPVYVAFLLAPTVNLPFAMVQTVFRWLLLFSIAASVPAWMYAMGFQTSPAFVLSGMVLAISTYPSVLEFHMQNLAALVAIFLAFAAAAAVRNCFSLSGFLLGLSTIKPQLSALVVLCILLWAAKGWQHRKRLVLSFTATMFALVLAGEIVLPRWIPEFAAAARAYSTYATDPSILQFVFGPALARILAVALCGVLLFVSWRLRMSLAGSTDFGWVLAWAATVTLAILPVTVYNQVLLVPAFLVLIRHWDNLPRLLPRALAKGVFVCQAWQWMTAVIISICSLLVSPERLRFLARVPVLTLIALPPLMLLAVAAGAISLQLITAIPRTPAAAHE
jgi:hypothetical protein